MNIKKIVAIFFIWRMALFIPILVGNIFLPYRLGYAYTNIWFYVKPYVPVNNILLFPWANFDGVHYLNISGNGYTTNARFLPLYPLLIRFVSFIFKGNIAFGTVQFTIALILSNLFFLLSLIMFFKLLKFDYSKKITSLSIIFLLIFPTSFFFASIYTESLFLLLTLLCFYFARQKKWLLVGGCGLLLTITRLPGILIFFVMLLEYFIYEKRLSAKIIPLLFIPIGILGYAWFNFNKWGDCLYFIKAHTQLANSRSVSSLILFPQTLYRYGKMLFSVSSAQFEWWIALFELLIFIFILIVLCVGWKKKIRIDYLLFALLNFLIPVSSGTFTALPRYVLIIFPIFIILASIKNTATKIIYTLFSLILLFILLMFFSRGYFIA